MNATLFPRRLFVRQRLLDAERRFFDAYSRGGGNDPRELVVPMDYFVRPVVRRVLEAWASGRKPLDQGALANEWRETGRPGTEERFYRNLAHFVSLV